MTTTHMQYTLWSHDRVEGGRPDETKPVWEWKGWDPVTLHLNTLPPPQPLTLSLP